MYADLNKAKNKKNGQNRDIVIDLNYGISATSGKMKKNIKIDN